MKAKEFIPASKPRNFVAKNQQTAGAGAHKDKKKAEKQGDVKHKAKQYEEGVAEGLGKNIKRAVAGWGAFDKDKPADVVKRVKGQDTATLKGLSNRGSTGKGSPAELQQKAISRELKKRGEQGVAEGSSGNDFRVGQRVIYKTSQGQEFPSIVTAVDFDEDAVKIKSANNKPFPNSGGDIEIVVDPGWKFLTVEPRVDPDSIIAVSPNMRKTTERIRDPEDWDEGNTEPPNNFAVYINGKKWKVFQGRGQFADDYKEMQHFRQLQTWAQQKSTQTGKKWEVYKTGEAPTA